MSKGEVKNITFRIKRYDPEKGKTWWQEYKVPVRRGMTLVDVYLYIKENLDPSLAVRYSCRMGICGSCGVVINGKPSLACETQILELGTDVVTVEPLPNYPVVRDLVVDFTGFFEKHRMVKPYLIRRDVEEQENPTREYRMLPEEYDYMVQFSYCIKCGLCYAACPVPAIDSKFLGPQALAQAFRYMIDVRDEGLKERVLVVDSEHGCWRCHFADACSAVCPKGIDPAQGIQLLRRMLISMRLSGVKEKKGSPVMPPMPPETKPKPGVKAPPPRTVKPEEAMKRIVKE